MARERAEELECSHFPLLLQIMRVSMILENRVRAWRLKYGCCICSPDGEKKIGRLHRRWIGTVRLQAVGLLVYRSCEI